MSSYYLLIPFLIYFYRWFFLDTNFYKMIGIFGKKGSGKTTYIAKMSQYYIKKGYPVYCNVNISGTYLYDPKDVGYYTFPPGSVVFCDEIGLIWHNRDYKNFKKAVIEWFKLQRHYKIRFYWFSQANDADKVIRDLTDLIYISRRLGKFSFMIPVTRVIDIGKNADGQGDIINNYKYGSIFGIKITFLPRYYGLYDSFEVPDLSLIDAVYQDYNDISRLYSDWKTVILYWIRSAFISFKNKIAALSFISR